MFGRKPTAVAGIIAMSLFIGGGVRAQQQAVTAAFAEHEVRISPCACGAPCNTNATTTTKVNSPNATVPIDSSKLTCPNIMTFSGSVNVNFPASVTGTLNANGTFDLQPPVTATARLSGSWNVQKNFRLLTFKVSDSIASGICGTVKYEKDFVPGTPGNYPIPGDLVATCTITRIGFTEGKAQISSFVSMSFGGTDVDEVYRGNALDVEVKTFFTLGTPPQIGLSQTLLTFDATESNDILTKPLRLTNTGGSTMKWQAEATTTSGGKWLDVSPTTGPPLAPGEGIDLKITVDPNKIVQSSVLAADLPQGNADTPFTDTLMAFIMVTAISGMRSLRILSLRYWQSLAFRSALFLQPLL